MKKVEPEKKITLVLRRTLVDAIDLEASYAGIPRYQLLQELLEQQYGHMEESIIRAMKQANASAVTERLY